jgi:PKD repeat protein
MRGTWRCVATLVLACGMAAVAAYTAEAAGGRGSLAGTSTGPSWQAMSDAELDSTLQSTAPVSGSVRAALGAPVLFMTQDGREVAGVPPESRNLPRLVLRRDGLLNPVTATRTLVVEVTGIDVPPATTTVVEAVFSTQSVDPDEFRRTGVQRRFVISQTRCITNTSNVMVTDLAVRFDVVMEHALPSRIDTPTDYYRFAVLLDGIPAFNPVDYAFLMENEYEVDLGTDQDGTAFTGRVYHCDMFPIGGGDPSSWLPRQDADDHVQNWLLPAMHSTFQMEVNDWGWGPLHEDWDDDDVLELFYGNGQDWYHRRSGQRFHPGDDIAISLIANTARGAFHTFRDQRSSTLVHEMFHAMQRNAALTAGGGHPDAYWDLVLEGQARMAESLAWPALPPTTNPDYLGAANFFIAHYLNASYAYINGNYHEPPDAHPDEPYNAAIYWRFLFEQAGGLQDPAAGMQILSEAYKAMHTCSCGQEPGIVAYFAEVMDRALGANGCVPFASFRESLDAFAQGVYGLSVAGGRCSTRAGGCGFSFYDPASMYRASTNVTLLPQYSGKVVWSSGQITPSYGIDFLEAPLDSSVNGEVVEVLLESDPQSAARFDLQVWPLKDTGAAQPASAAEPVLVARRTVEGELLHFTWPITTALSDRLGLIVTRVDADEVDDPNGVYTITIRPSDIVPRTNITTTVWPGYCPPVDFYAEVAGWAVRLDVKDSNTGELLQEIPLDLDFGEMATVYLFTVLPGDEIDVRITAVGTWWDSERISFRNECMGGDHPDDNLSASSYTLHFDLSDPAPGIRDEQKAAVLSGGFFWAAEDFAEMAGEPTQWINPDFDPVATAADYPVLIIPSGGLYGTENSPSFRARLEEYARLGGTIVAFSQQHGYEYGALPGGELAGYGWSEDNSCFHSSLYLSEYHAVLSGFDENRIDAHVDGYFSSWPDEARLLLSRTANGMPAAVLYPFADGYVLATTIYDDWGTGQGQQSADSLVLLRDLLTWAIRAPQHGLRPDGGLPQFSPSDPVRLEIELTNTSPVSAAAIQLSFVTPQREVVLTRTVQATLRPSQTHTILPSDYAPLVPSDYAAPLGVWRVDGVLLVSGDAPLTEAGQVARFVVSDPADVVDLAPDLSLSVNAPSERFVKGASTTFTFTARNSSDVERTVTLEYWMPHHLWETGDSSYGDFSLRNRRTLTIPAYGETTYEWARVIRISSDRLWARLVGGGQVAEAHFAVYGVNPSLRVVPSVAPYVVERGGETTVDARAYSLSGAPCTAIFQVTARDSAGTLYHTAYVTATVGSGLLQDESGATYTPISHTFSIPLDVAYGTGQVWIEARSLEGRQLGGAVTTLKVPDSPLAISLLTPPPLEGGSSAALTVALTNTSSSLAVSAGSVGLALALPDGNRIVAGPASFSLEPGASTTESFTVDLPPLALGTYTVEVRTTDLYGEKRLDTAWSTIPVVQGALDRSWYRMRDVAVLDVGLANQGPFVLPLEIALSSGFGFSTASSLQLEPNTEDTAAFEVPIPTSAEPGGHALTVALQLPSGERIHLSMPPIQLPPSELTTALASVSLAAGESLRLAIANEGGVDTTAEVELSLVDARARKVAGESAVVPIEAGASSTVLLPLPGGAADGSYSLIGSILDSRTALEDDVFKLVTVDGSAAELTVATGAPAYLANDTMEFSASLANGPWAIDGGMLTLRVTQLAGTELAARPELAAYTPANSEIGGGEVWDVAIDGEGSVWFATAPAWDDELGEYVGGGVSVLHTDGTWARYTTANSPLSDDAVHRVAVGDDGSAWFITDVAAVDARLANGTWQHHTPADYGLPDTWPTDVAVDGFGNVWVATEPPGPDFYDDGGVSVLRTDGNWEAYSVADSGLCDNVIYAIEPDAQGNVWFAGWAINAACVRRADGSWTTYTAANSGLEEGWITSIAAAPNGDVWFGYTYDDWAASVLRAGGLEWDHYDYPELPDVYLEGTADIEVDQLGNVWFSFREVVSVLFTDPVAELVGCRWMHWTADDGLTGQATALGIGGEGTIWVATLENPWREEPGGAVAIDGPPWLVSAAEAPGWETYVEPFVNSRYDWYESDGVRALTVDPAGNRWFVEQVYFGEGCETFIHRLSADESRWDLWATILYDQEQNAHAWNVEAIEVDADGRLWLADGSSGVWVGTLEYDDWEWQYVTTASTAGGLPAGRLTLDATPEGRIWFAGGDNGPTEGGGVSVLSGTTWITYTTASSGLPSNGVRDLAVDRAGNAWFLLDDVAPVAARLADGTWVSFSAEDSPLPSNCVTDVAIDGRGNVYLATVTEWDPGSDRWVGAALTIVDTGGSWSVYTTADGMPDGPVLDMAVQPDGRVWLAAGLDAEWEADRVVSLTPDSGEFMEAADMPGGEPYSAILLDLMVDSAGDLWCAWNARYDEDYGKYVGGVTRYRNPSARRVLWEWTRQVSLGGSEERTELVDALASHIGATGQLHLEGELEAATGQPLAWDEVLFTIYEEPVPALSLEVIPSVVRPGDQLLLRGSVHNPSPLPLEEWGVYLLLRGAGAIELYADEGIPAGATWQYSATLPAPLSERTYTPFAADGVSVVTGRFEVVAPALDAALSGPEVVGSEPFDLVLTLANPTPLTLDLVVDFDGEVIPIALGPEESRALVRAYTVSEGTSFNVAISGDATHALTHSVTYGEGLAASFVPLPAYPQGMVTVPYELSNTGLLPLSFSTEVTLRPSGGGELFTRSFESYIPAGETLSGELLFELEPGEYTLSYVTPLAEGETSFQIAPLTQVALSADVGEREGSVVTVTAAISNTGLASLDGVVRVEAPFFESEQEIVVQGGGSASLDLPVDLSTAGEGTCPAVVSLLCRAGQVLASTEVSIQAPGAELVLTASPAGTVVGAGQEVELLFGVRNSGAAPATAVISVTLGDLVDEAQSLWLAGGGEGALSFLFRAPGGLSGESVVGEFWFAGQRHDLTLPVAGLKLDVSAEWDQDAYAPGEQAALLLTVSNEGAAATLDMYAHVAYGGDVFTQPLSLPAGGSEALSFPLVAQLGADPKVFYAVYEMAEQRGVVLNTTYLYVRHTDVTVLLDSRVYQPGDTVQATIITTATGELAVAAPGFESAIALPASGFQFTLPTDVARGSYAIDYGLEGGERHSVPFDVDAPWVRVTEARLLGLPYEAGDQVQVDLTIASTDALAAGLRAWVLGPDLTRGPETEISLSLAAAPNNRVGLSLPLSAEQAGRYRLVYLLTAAGEPDLVYASGSESFDLGAATILGLRTSKGEYEGTDEAVTAVVTLFAPEPTEATVELLLDGAAAVVQELSLAGGVETVELGLPGPLSPARHTLTARVSAGGLSHSAQTEFDYGTAASDLAAGTPYLVPGTGSPRTIQVVVYNRGQQDSTSTEAQLWDGSPDEGGVLLATLDLPALEAGRAIDFEVSWDVLDGAGPHTLVLVADAPDLVAEFYEGNNRARRDVLLPAFDLGLETSSFEYSVGETVVLTVTATNLSAAPEIIWLTTMVEQPVLEYFEDAVIPGGTEVVFTDTRSIVVAAGGEVSEVVEWDTAGMAEDEYTVLVQGVDQSGEAASAGAVIYLEQTTVPPQVDAGPDSAGDEGAGIAFAGSIVDPDTPEGHEVTWDFGDGAISTGVLTVTHAYEDDGVYVATLTVTDTTGLAGTDSLQVTVSNVAPLVDAGSDRTVDEGSWVTFAGSFSDPGVRDTFGIVWEFGDGGVGGGTLYPSHFYAEDGIHTVTLTVTDDDGGTGSDTLLVTVDNVQPTVAAWAEPEYLRPREEVTFGGTFWDPGVLDEHSFRWDFGDGSTSTGNLTTTHAYDLGGVYTATLSVFDDDGGVGQASVVLGVALELYPIAVHVDTVAGAVVGQELEDVLNGGGAGNFGWLSWTGSSSKKVLGQSLTPYGDSDGYVNPDDPDDSTLSAGDRVCGVPGVGNSKKVRSALEVLKDYVITVPVWDEATGKGNNLRYHVVGFARIQITAYHLPGDKLISAIFWGMTASPEE